MKRIENRLRLLVELAAFSEGKEKLPIFGLVGRCSRHSVNVRTFIAVCQDLNIITKDGHATKTRWFYNPSYIADHNLASMVYNKEVSMRNDQKEEKETEEVSNLLPSNHFTKNLTSMDAIITLAEIAIRYEIPKEKIKDFVKEMSRVLKS